MVVPVEEGEGFLAENYEYSVESFGNFGQAEKQDGDSGGSITPKRSGKIAHGLLEAFDGEEVDEVGYCARGSPEREDGKT